LAEVEKEKISVHVGVVKEGGQEKERERDGWTPLHLKLDRINEL